MNSLHIRFDKHLTVENLHHILTNQTYIAVRRYKEHGKMLEAKAMWEPVIDEKLFYRVQKKLKANRSKKKPHSDKRYPYLLSGLTFCGTCVDVMCGKSAHGNGGKIGYYEHSWATKRESCLSKKTFHCEPHRVLAKKLEPLVTEKVGYMLNNKNFAENLFMRLRELRKMDTQGKQHDSLKARLHGITSQIDALAERLADLPKRISPGPIYKQMEILEERKEQIQKEFEFELKKGERPTDTPISLKDFESFRVALCKLWRDAGNPDTKAKIIQKLIHKIEIAETRVKIHFHAGLNHFLISVGSNTLTSGARTGT